MRLTRRRAAEEEDRALLAAARAGDEDALALLRAGLRGEPLVRARELLREREPAALRRALHRQAAAPLLAGLGPRTRAELLGTPAPDACRGAGLVAGASGQAEREAAAAHAAVCRSCRGLR